MSGWLPNGGFGSGGADLGERGVLPGVDRGVRGAENRGERVPLELPNVMDLDRRVEPEELEHGRVEIDRLNEGGRRLAVRRGDPWHVHDERHPGDEVKVALFAPSALLAQMPPVVAVEDLQARCKTDRVGGKSGSEN